MNIANKFTVFRLLLIPVFVIAFMTYGTSNILSALIFIVASLTDFIDGYLARSRNLITTFGKFLDPLADKMLATTALIMLIQLGKVPAWVVVIIVCREFIVTGFRIIAASNNITIAASIWGKYKTATQFIAIILLLLNNKIIVQLPLPLDYIFLYISLILTIISAVDYVAKNIKVLDLNNI